AAATPGAVLDPDRAAVNTDGTPAEHQPQSVATAGGAARPSLDAAVLLEDQLPVRRRHALAFVADADLDRPLGAVIHGRRQDLDADRRVAGPVLVGVVDQVLENPPDEIAI